MDNKNPQEQAFVQRIRAGMPVLSPETQRILRACENPAIDLETLAEVLGQSPAIAARLLGLANSSFYCLGSPATSLHKAIQVLGLVTVRGVATGLVISDRFSARRCPPFDAVRFWESAVLTAQFAQQLAPRVPPEHDLLREAVYMAGLLHNIGLLALVSVEPDAMSELLEVPAGESAGSLGGRLRQRFGFDHRQVAGWLAETWHLPAALGAVLAHCHSPGYSGEYKALVLLTGLCARLAHKTIDSGGRIELPQRSPAGDVAASLGIAADAVANVLARAGASLDALRATAETFTKGTT
jgi:HD-like signal output (HDOD) protein